MGRNDSWPARLKVYLDREIYKVCERSFVWGTERLAQRGTSVRGFQLGKRVTGRNTLPQMKPPDRRHSLLYGEC